MKLDLWQFDENTLKEAAEDLPNSILKEQADLLYDKTDGTIYGKITNMKFEPQEDNVNYSLATMFEAIVPRLDNYHFTLFTLYSKPEENYPLAITVGSNIIDDAIIFTPDFVCRDKDEFIMALKKILSSDELNKNISTLYAKANS